MSKDQPVAITPDLSKRIVELILRMTPEERQAFIARHKNRK